LCDLLYFDKWRLPHQFAISKVFITLYDYVLIPLSQWLGQHQVATQAEAFLISFAESIVLLSILLPSTVLLKGRGGG